VTIKTLVISNLYPNREFPRHGIFTEHRMRNMAGSGRVDMRVLSPVPWFPLRRERFGTYGAHARVPEREIRHGIEVRYPRFPVIPKVGMSLSGLLLALALVGPVRRLIREGFDFELIDAYYFYPDGVAAALLGRWLNKPVVITAYGNDLSLIADYALPRWQIRWAAGRAAGMTTVCQALKDRLVALGADERRVKVVLHGVDLELFQPPTDRAALRAELGIEPPTLLSVGHLIERKGHHFVIEALRELPDMGLIIAGDGEELPRLRVLAHDCGVSDRVRFLGHVDQSRLPDYYGAADALVLASSREGIANVMMEALACGTPVVATAVWGAPEVITDPVAGVLIDQRSGAGVAAGVRQLFAHRPERAATRRFVERYTWEQTTADHLAVFDAVLNRASD
jgi:teichuronic acid biosynthesis glycosyltransferase TuaC